MRLLEFQSKNLLSQYSVPVPRGILVKNEDELGNLHYPVMLKAQVPAGGRGKAGGIKKACTISEARDIMRELVNVRIKGKKVCGFLAEECVTGERELYLALTIDKEENMLVIVASSAGGMDIEDVAKHAPEKIFKNYVNPFIGLQQYMVRTISKQMNISQKKEFEQVILNLFKLFRDIDAYLIEINPLIQLGNQYIALDAKIELDRKAQYRHPQLFEKLEQEQHVLSGEQKTRAETLAETFGITYIPLEGELAVISDGAGTGMLTLDLIHDAGGRPACLCEMGGITNAETMFHCLEIVREHPAVKGVLVLLIGGLNRMDEMAEGIVKFISTRGASLPLVIRMCGTNEVLGTSMLQHHGIKTYDDICLAVRDALDEIRGR